MKRIGVSGDTASTIRRPGLYEQDVRVPAGLPLDGDTRFE
jgi:hypothetical protein